MWSTYWEALAAFLVDRTATEDLSARLALQLTFFCCLDTSVLMALSESDFEQRGDCLTLNAETREGKRLMYLVPPIIETLSLMRDRHLLGSEFGSQTHMEQSVFHVSSGALTTRVNKLIRLAGKGAGLWLDNDAPTLRNVKSWGKSHAAEHISAMWQLVGVVMGDKFLVAEYLPERRSLSGEDVTLLYANLRRAEAE